MNCYTLFTLLMQTLCFVTGLYLGHDIAMREMEASICEMTSETTIVENDKTKSN